jgi:hypothetical protein
MTNVAVALNTQISKNRVKKIWTEAFSNNIQVKKIPLREYLVASILINLLVIGIVAILAYNKNLPPEVPLFYGAPEGEEQLASNWALMVPAGISITFTCINASLCYLINDEYLKKSLIIAGLVITTLSTITTLKIIALISAF